MNKIELLTKKIELRKRVSDILSKGKAEKRVLKDSETKELEEIRKGLEDCNTQIADLDKQLEDRKKTADENRKKEVNINRMKNSTTLVSEIRKRLNGSVTTPIVVPAFKMDERAYSVDGNGGNIVSTEIEPLLTGLYSKNVLGQFTTLTGLTSNVQIPIMGKNNVGWSGEVATASATDSSITAITLKPKGLTAYADISKNLIMQSSSNIEEIIRQDLQNAVIDKLQSTILGSAAGSDTQPAGLFVDASVLGAVDYQHVAEIEEDIEDENVVASGYVINPAVKAKTRQVARAQGQGGFLFDNGELDGMPTFVTSACKGILYGNLKDYVLGQWGNVNVTIDPYSQAINNLVRLVINANFDGGIRRPGAVKAYTLPTA